MNELNQFSPHLQYEDHQAGMQIATFLDEKIDDKLIANELNLSGVAAIALSSHYAVNKPRSGLLLGFCPYTDSELRHNISLLKRCLSKVMPNAFVDT
ncbi:MAG: DNA-binding transcriptional MocR family regulator [Parasphingorhabdus sp.]|jgi:DNA-binding transcriptional MocR family regulator